MGFTCSPFSAQHAIIAAVLSLPADVQLLVRLLPVNDSVRDVKMQTVLY